MGWFHGLVPDGIVFRDFAGSTAVHTVGAVHRPGRRHRPRPTPRPQVRPGRRRPHAAARPQHRRHRRRACCGSAGTASTPARPCRPWTGRASAGWPSTPRSPPAPAAWSPCSSSIPAAKKWDVGMSINGFLGGLVAITAPCYWVSPAAAVIIGAVAGILVPLATDLLEHLRIDDPVGAVPVHGACGIWGTLAVGLFASGQYGIPTADRRRQHRRRSRASSTAAAPASSSPRSSAASAASWWSASSAFVLMFGIREHPGQLEPAPRPGAGARGHRHRPARPARLPHGVRPGHDLHRRRRVPPSSPPSTVTRPVAPRPEGPSWPIS